MSNICSQLQARAGFRDACIRRSGWWLLGQLRLPRRLHRGEIVAGVIAGARERACRDLEEALGPGNGAEGAKRLGRDEILDTRMARSRLEILPHGDEIDIGAAHVVHHLMDLEPLLAEPEHDPALGEDQRIMPLHFLEQPQRGIVARARTVVGYNLGTVSRLG